MFPLKCKLRSFAYGDILHEFKCYWKLGKQSSLFLTVLSFYKKAVCGEKSKSHHKVLSVFDSVNLTAKLLVNIVFVRIIFLEIVLKNTSH